MRILGESNNIEKRFFEHYRSLVDGSHFNLGLLKGVSDYGINNIYFFVLYYGYEYTDLELRRKKQIDAFLAKVLFII